MIPGIEVAASTDLDSKSRQKEKRRDGMTQAAVTSKRKT